MTIVEVLTSSAASILYAFAFIFAFASIYIFQKKRRLNYFQRFSMILLMLGMLLRIVLLGLP